MKILLINNFNYRKGGADVVYLNTGVLLEKYGHEVIYFSQKTENTNDNEFVQNIYYTKSVDYLKAGLGKKMLNSINFFYSKSSKSSINKLIEIEKPDIAHIHQYKGVFTSSILVELKNKKIPVVFTLHDYQLLCPYVSFLNGEKKICVKCLTENSINCIISKCNHNSYIYSTISYLEFNFNKYITPPSIYFSKLICVSNFSFNLHSKNSAISEKLLHLYNFFPNIDIVETNPVKGNYVMFYGRLVEEKGIMTLLNAWKNNKRKMKLKIIGDGPMFDFCKFYIIENNLDNIDLLGFKKGDDLNNLIKNASFIIVPSECYENNPLTIIEAYAFGKPVVGSRIGGIPEMIVENSTGFIFDIYDDVRLSEILVDIENMSDTDYSIFSNNARQFCKDNFDEENHYKKLLNIYSELLEN